jgi:rhodanese-related sulfurtransferase
MPASELAGMLYDSLHNKLLKLPDEVQVFPAHGAGSMCGRNISNERTSTIGHERRFNYALQPMSRQAFIELLTTDLPEAPAYFSRDAQINLEGAPSLEDIPVPKALSPEEVSKLQAEGSVVLDVRPSNAYGTAHIRGSLHISLSGQFATWAGSLLQPGDSIVLITEDEEQLMEARTRLARVGFDRVAGYLKGGILEWDRSGLPLDSIQQISVEELSHRMAAGDIDHVVDVRRPQEWKTGHIVRATSVPLNHLKERAADLGRDARVAVLCAGGFRSAIASSILERQGFSRISNVVGGMAAWNAAKLPLDNKSEPSD